jgi:hypothetical protein
MDKRTVGVDHSILLKKRKMFKFDSMEIRQRYKDARTNWKRNTYLRPQAG